MERDLTLHLGERDVGEPSADQLLVRVEWAGVCGSDLHVLRTGDWVTEWPATLGHEVVGVVEASPGGSVPEGSRVVVDSRVPCGTCDICAVAPQRCEQLGWFGEVCPGGFEGHVLVPSRGVAICPEGLEASVAVLAEPLAVAMHAVGRAVAGWAAAGREAVGRAATGPAHAIVLGYGPIGALVHLELSRRLPATTVSVVEPDRGRLQLAEALGARPLEALGAGARTVAAPGGRPDLVVDAAGYPGSLTDALGSCAPGGTVLVVALAHQPVTVVPAGIVEHELTVAGSVGFSDELPAAVAALAADPDRYRPLVTEAVLLEEAPGRLRALLGSPSVGKVLIGPSWT